MPFWNGCRRSRGGWTAFRIGVSWKERFLHLLQRCASIFSSHRRTSTGNHVSKINNKTNQHTTQCKGNVFLHIWNYSARVKKSKKKKKKGKAKTKIKTCGDSLEQFAVAKKNSRSCRTSFQNAEKHRESCRKLCRQMDNRTYETMDN